MPTPLRRRVRKVRRYAWYVLALLLVGVAVLVGTLSQLLPLVEQRPQQVAAWLSERAGRPIAFDSLKTAWTRRGPLLQLDGLRIGDGEGVSVGQAEVLVSIYAGLLPGASLTELRLRGLSLQLRRHDDGRWEVQGLPSTGTGGDPLEALRSLGELQIIGGRLGVHAPSLDIDAEVLRLDMRVRVEGERLRVGARGWIATDAAPLTAVVDFQRGSGDGQVWLSAAPAELDAWSSLAHVAGIQLVKGRGNLRAWADLRGHRVTAITTEADLADVALQGTPFVAGGPAPTAGFDVLQLRARWQLVDGGWRLDAPRLRIGADKRKVARLDGLLLAAGKRYALQGERIELTDLMRAAALTNQLDAGVRQWLYAARPQLRFARVDMAGAAGGALRGQGELEMLGFSPVGDSPGVRGLHGHFEGDGQGLALRLEPGKAVQFDWPSGFGVVHELQLAGDVVAWPEGKGWRLGTPALRVDGEQYAADVRGGVWFQGDGTLPWLELAAKLDDAPLIVAKNFWVRHQMSTAAVDWLNAALVDGQLKDGYGLVTGDLDDWPFTGNNGRFEAAGRIVGGDIRFAADWPVMEGVNADIAFINNGFAMHGSGNLAGVPVDRFDAGIENFRQSHLYVRASSRSDAAALHGMLKRSPLQAQYATTLDNVVASGPAAVTFDLLQPLHNDGGGHLRGQVELRGARLADPRWDVAFDNVRGVAQYSSEGFSAPQLAVSHQGRAGTLALRAGGYVQDPALAFESAFTAPLEAAGLLKRAPELAWLQPYIDGLSSWTVAVDVPRSAPGSSQDVPARLHLRSDLVGTQLRFPVPLDKPAEQPLATTVTAALPMDAGRVEVAFGSRLALAARTQHGKTGVQVTLGTSRVDQDPPPEGLNINGRTPALDALEWVTLARGAQPDAAPGANAGTSLRLNQVDVLADRLQIIGGQFADTRIRLRPQASTIEVQLDGQMLAGRVQVPHDERQTISGTLDRLYWKPLAPAAPEAPAAGLLPVQDPINPANVPPLALEVADLQFGPARLGHAQLRTRPQGNGLKIEQLQLRSPKQAIDVQGSWDGLGEQAQTRLQVQVDSEDLGGLMAGLGLQGQLRSGQGQVRFDGGWAGSPSGFALQRLQGQLNVQARNGQLLEVDPGVGRVLGALSVTQLPRRLLLDFHDMFSKGLAFNQIQGQVQFGDGVARTDRMAIQAPAADIEIRGQTDLRTQTFDQIIDVNPRSGNLLTVVGAVAGGPVGAAVGAAANAVLAKPLGEIGAKTYKVSGPWKDPKVDVVERGSPATAPKP